MDTTMGAMSCMTLSNLGPIRAESLLETHALLQPRARSVSFQWACDLLVSSRLPQLAIPCSILAEWCCPMEKARAMVWQLVMMKRGANCLHSFGSIVTGGASSPLAHPFLQARLLNEDNGDSLTEHQMQKLSMLNCQFGNPRHVKSAALQRLFANRQTQPASTIRPEA